MPLSIPKDKSHTISSIHTLFFSLSILTHRALHNYGTFLSFLTIEIQGYSKKDLLYAKQTNKKFLSITCPVLKIFYLHSHL